MSDLQLGLLALGARAVAGVLGFNKWQEMRARRDGVRHFGSAHDDVLLGGEAANPAAREAAGEAGGAIEGKGGSANRERIEPVWDRAAAAPDTDVAQPSAATVISASEASAAPAARIDVTDDVSFDFDKAAPPRTDGPAPILDPRIDFIAEVIVEEALLGTHVMLEVEKFPRGRNIDLDGFNEVARAWEALDRDAVYENVRVGIQISDRSGPLRADELAAFQHCVNGMAQAFGGRVEWPGEQNPLTRAAELDAFCAGVDVQIGINVVAAAPFADTKLRGLAEANGFTSEGDGVFRRRDEEGGEVLTLKQASPEALSLALDVPRVRRDAAALALMAQCAKRMAAGINGKLVDDNGKPLNDAGIAAIQASLAGIYGRMEAAAMPAGSVLARRVFS